MKLLESSNKVERLDPVLKKHDYTIAQNSKVFSFFSDKLYKYKVLAVLRELSTNAQDESNRFDVHLPSVMSPVFWIRDYGPGMSPETVSKIYTVYGKSTKDDSNEQTGCLGLGSKSPFCYHTKTFTVESFHNGKHYIYNCFIDEDGNPTCELVSELETQEPNGLKVSLPTNKSDYDAWNSAAQQVYSVFKCKPNFVGKNIPTIEYPKYSLEVGNVKLDDNRGGQARLIMGSVAYPINMPNVDKKYLDLQSLPVDIYAEIGDVSITISREELSYDPRTVARIKAYYEVFIQNLTQKIEKEIADAKSLFDARRKYCIYVESLRKIYGLFSSVSNVKWNGIKLFDNPDWAIQFRGDLVSSRQFSFNQYSGSKYQVDRDDAIRLPFNYIYKKEIILDDMKIGAIVRTCLYVHNAGRSGNGVLLIRPMDGVTLEQAKQHAIDMLGLPQDYQFKLSSTLPEATVRTGVKRGKTIDTLLFQVNSRKVDDAWVNYDMSVSGNEVDGGVYVEISNKQPVNSQFTDVYTLRSRLNQLIRLNIPVPKIFGVKKSVIEDFKADSNWVHLDKALQDATASIANNPTYHMLKEWMNIRYDDKLHLTYGFVNANKIHLKDSPKLLELEALYTKYNRLFDTHQKTVAYFDEILKMANVTLAKSKEIKEFVELFKEIRTKWPMLELIQATTFATLSQSVRNDIVNYLKAK